MVYAVAMKPNGQIVIGGNFTQYNGSTSNTLAVLNSDGTIDSSFNPGVGVSQAPSSYVGGIAQALAVQPDGKILVGGQFNYYGTDGINCLHSGLLRITAIGACDNTFPNYVVAVDVHAIALQSNGMIVIGGSYNGIRRIQSDGQYDTAFTAPSISGTVEAVAVQSNGKILGGGTFTSVGGESAVRIVRLNADGSMDGTFVVGNGFNGNVNELMIQSDGKVIAVGTFSQYDGAAAAGVARLLGGG
jgi:uncharacterized delta-60 repeat protein